MSARRRRGEDEFADERLWLDEDDESGRWPPDAEDSWPDDDPDTASGASRHGRHSASPGDPGGGWDSAATVPRQAGPYGRPGPGREEPGWDDRYALQRDPEPPPSHGAPPWDEDPLARDPYPGGTPGNGLRGDRYAGPPGRGPAGQDPDPGAAGRGSRRAGRRGTPPAATPRPPAGYQDAGYQDSRDRYADPAGQGTGPLRRPSGRGGRGGDPAGRYGDPGGQYGDAGQYGDPGGRYGGHDDRYADTGGWDRQPAGRYRDPGEPYGDPGRRNGDMGGRYRDPAARYGDPGGRDDDPDAPYGDPGDRGRGYGDPREWPDTPSGQRPGSRGRYAGSGDGYPPPGRGGPDRYPADRDGGRAAEPDDDLGWDDEDDYGDEGWPFGGDDSADGSGRRPRRKRRGRWAGPSSLFIVAAIILIPLIAGGIYAYRVIAAHYDPPNYSGAGTGTVVFEVKPGDNSQTVGDRLVTDGVVASSRALVLAAEHSGNASKLEPGYYRLHKHMNAQLAWNLLVSPSARVQLKVTIPEGWRVSQTLAELAKQSHIPASDFTKAIKDTKALGLPSYAKGNPEGYLFPATYDIAPNATATSVLKSMVTAFNQTAASVNLPREAAHGNLTPAEAIVVASLAQAEGGKDSDFPKITRVIYNRLQAHMPLDLDSTVLFALNTYGILASDQQLKVKSPYNTYTHQGLPPGPIDSPGKAAIEAALHPASGNWLYFVTVNPKTKQTDFTASPTVFQQLKNELQRNLAHGG